MRFIDCRHRAAGAAARARSSAGDFAGRISFRADLAVTMRHVAVRQACWLLIDDAGFRRSIAKARRVGAADVAAEHDARKISRALMRRIGGMSGARPSRRRRRRRNQ